MQISICDMKFYLYQGTQKYGIPEIPISVIRKGGKKSGGALLTVGSMRNIW